jgi:tetratricopeptide (TPR) repeat protein
LKSLFLVGESDGSFRDRITIAHEYVHAEQDQQFQNVYLENSAASDDMYRAVLAVSEGDAELAEAKYLQGLVPVQDDLVYPWTAGESGGEKSTAIPQFLRDRQSFSYDEGLSFVRTAYESGGWAAVDKLYRNPPVSTEQILHPALYRQGHTPVAVALPVLASRLGGDWGLAETGVLGELGWRLALAPYIGRVPAAAAAKGWGGDRYALLRQGNSGAYAAVFQTEWDSEAEAMEFAEAASRWLDRRFEGNQVEGDLLADEPVRHWSNNGRDWFLRRQGQKVTLVDAPGKEPAQQLLAADYPSTFQCQSDVYVSNGNAEQKLAKLSSEIGANPSPGALQQRAAIYLSQDDTTRAIADLDRVIAAEPDNRAALLDRGRAYFYQGDDGLAIGDLSRVLELRPADYDARLYRARAYSAKADYAHADEDFEAALRLYPSDAYVHYHRARSYEARVDQTQALSSYEQAISLLPDFADPDCQKALMHDARGQVWLDKGDYDRAIEDFSHAVDLRPDDAKLLNDRAGAYADKGDVDKGLADANRAIQMDSGFADAYLQRGYLYVIQESFDPAVADFAKVIELAPDAPEGYIGRGYAYVLRGLKYDDEGHNLRARIDFWSTITDCNKAIELDPENETAYYYRGLAYHGRGKLKQAIDDYTRAIALAPDWDHPYRRRGYAYEEQGQKALAIADFQKFLELTDDTDQRKEIEQELTSLRDG